MIEAFDSWWNTNPEPHISKPRDCAVRQDKIMAIWISAWNECQKYKGEKVTTFTTDDREEAEKKPEPPTKPEQTYKEPIPFCGWLEIAIDERKFLKTQKRKAGKNNG